MRTSRPSSRTAWGVAVLLGAVAVVAVVGIVLDRGVGPLPGRERCTTVVGGHRVDLDPDQSRNATLIAAIGVRRGLPARAVSIALATAFQESKLRNLDHGDRDSLGLFQQRPSQGWGTVAQVRDPYHATNRFYDALAKVDGFQQMRITEAAQRVQRSGYPEAYEPHAEDARALASALTGYSPGGRFACLVKSSADDGTAERTITDLERGFGQLDVRRGGRQDLTVHVAGNAAGLRRGWAVAAYLVAHARGLGLDSVAYAGRRWQVGEKGWSRVGGSREVLSVSLG